MWACRPTSSSFSEASTRSIACRRQPVLEPEAELRVELAGLDVVVGRGLDPGRDPDQHPLRFVEQALAALDLVEGVEDQVADAGPGREEDLLVGLVVAVHVDAGGVEAGAQRHVQLAAGGDVDREALLGEEPVGGGAGHRLAGEEDLVVGAAALEGVAVGAGAGAHVVLGVDVGGGAELGGQLDHVAAGDLEMAALVYAAALREDRRARDRIAARDRSRMCSLRHRTGIVTVRARAEPGQRLGLSKPPTALGGPVDDFSDRRFRPDDAVDDFFGDPRHPGFFECTAGDRLVDLVDRFVDGVRHVARRRGGGRPRLRRFRRRHRRSRRQPRCSARSRGRRLPGWSSPWWTPPPRRSATAERRSIAAGLPVRATASSDGLGAPARPRSPPPPFAASAPPPGDPRLLAQP